VVGMSVDSIVESVVLYDSRSWFLDAVHNQHRRLAIGVIATGAYDTLDRLLSTLLMIYFQLLLMLFDDFLLSFGYTSKM
jgi:hypothetical protein